MKNKKGFTLVELMAVISVLAILILVGGFAVTRILSNTRETAAEEMLSNLEDAALTYAVAERIKLQPCELENCNTDKGVYSCSNNCVDGTQKKEVTIQTLKDEDYFEDADNKCKTEYETKEKTKVEITMDSNYDFKINFPDNKICD